MLILLEEEEQISNLTLQETNKKKYKFSDGFVQISVENINFLKDRTISDVVFSPHNPNTILTVHRTAKDVSYCNASISYITNLVRFSIVVGR